MQASRTEPLHTSIIVLTLVFVVALGIHPVRDLFKTSGQLSGSFFANLYLFIGVVTTGFLLFSEHFIRFDLPEARAVFIGFVTGLGLFVVTAAGYAFVQLTTELVQSPLTRPSGAGQWALLLGTFILPVISEEVAFRGLILNALTDVTGDRQAIVLSSALFSLYHFSAFQLLSTFILGLGLGLLVVRYESIWPAVVAHGVVNGAGLILFTSSSASL